MDPRDDVLAAVARCVPPERPGGWTLVGVDGGDGAGKTTFADALAVVLRAGGREVVRIGVDDFHHPRAHRYRRGRTSPEGFWLDSFDLDLLDRLVLAPLSPGGTGRFRARGHDVGTDQHVHDVEQVAPPGAVVLVDGLFLHRAELRDRWDLTVFLDAPFEVTAARMAVRDGTHPDPDHPSMRRYVEAQRIYRRDSAPADRADVVVDNTDPARPVLLRP